MEPHVVFLAVVTMLTFPAFSQSQALRVANFNLDGKLALSGCDPAAYFKQGKAVKGKKQIASGFQGVTYYFANEPDKAEFAKNRRTTNRSTADGVLLRWVLGARKSKSTPKRLRS